MGEDLGGARLWAPATWSGEERTRGRERLWSGGGGGLLGWGGVRPQSAVAGSEGVGGH